MLNHGLHTALNLHLFDGEGAVATSAGDAPTGKAVPERNPLAKIQYGKQEGSAQDTQAVQKDAQEPETIVTADTQEARKAEFEKLIKGDYKDLFDERAQRIIDARFKEVKTLEAKAAQSETLAPVLDMLASKYGVDGKDVAALVKAIEEDDGFYEEEALKKGLTVEQLKYMRKVERENAEFRRTAEERQRIENADRIYAQWQQQSESCKAMYPAFDLRAECSHAETGERFLGLLKSGVDVQTAFEVVHKDELIGGAMQYTAQAIQEKTINDIRARGLRPSENGGGGNGAAAIVKTDPRTFTKKDREEISRRVMRGERIEL